MAKGYWELCKNNNCCILNGRFGTNSNVGHYTCKGASVVDYAIVSYALLPLCNDFEVLGFDPLLSDVHCSIILNLVSKHPDTVENSLIEYDNKVSKAIWRKDRKF